MSSALIVRPPSRPRASTGGLTAFGLIALVVGLTACSSPSGPSGVATAPSGSVSVSPLPAIQPLPCDPSTAAPGETVTNGPGSQESAISIVAEYHYAVITARDTARATRAVKAGNPMATPELISQALDGYPAGSTYCLRMRQTRPDTVLLTLTTQPPSGGVTSYRLQASVAGSPGSMLLTGEVSQ
ncbi:hypothetical protein ACXVUM_07535 [Williamsia sp. SKLECPSW1]